jgi:tRNA (guanine-N7-)-methyltransferase
MEDSASGSSLLDNAPRPEYLAKVVATRAELRADLQAALGAAKRFVWEVGCGHGHFLTAYADRHRDVPCIGIDLLNERLVRATKKKNRARLPHLHFIRADAQMFLEELPAHLEFAAIYVLFSDPWPKKRHHKNRIIQGRFLSDVARHAPAGVPLYFRTDHSGYFSAALEIVQAHPDWRVDPEAPWPFELPTVFQQRAESFQSIVALRR